MGVKSDFHLFPGEMSLKQLTFDEMIGKPLMACF
jgi:hypothetical protein